jgi:hypothetical protein
LRGAVSSGGVLPPQRQLLGVSRPRGRANRHDLSATCRQACRQVAESRIRDWLIGVQSPPAMYARHMVDGRSHTVFKGDGSEKESQVRHLGTESTPWFGAGPHTHRHQTAVFRSGETCPEAGIKRALPSDILGPSPQGPLPVNHVRGNALLEF